MVAKNYSIIFLAAVVLIISGCASTTQTGTASAEALRSTSLSEVPSLKVVVDCGTCLVKPKPTIPTLIIDGYNEAAGKDGRKVSTTTEATLTIKEYMSRTDAARLAFGAFAGKDEIKAVIAYQGKTYVVEDYYRNAWLGIDALATKIGEMSYNELVK